MLRFNDVNQPYNYISTSNVKCILYINDGSSQNTIPLRVQIKFNYVMTETTPHYLFLILYLVFTVCNLKYNKYLLLILKFAVLFKIYFRHPFNLF